MQEKANMFFLNLDYFCNYGKATNIFFLVVTLKLKCREPIRNQRKVL